MNPDSKEFKDLLNKLSQENLEKYKRILKEKIKQVDKSSEKVYTYNNRGEKT